MSDMATSSSPAVRARRTWNMDQWGSGYFDVDDHGQALVRPLGSDAEGPALPISALVRQLQSAGLQKKKKKLRKKGAKRENEK